MTDKKYMTELPREEVTKMLQYPSELWNYMYGIVAEHNGMWAGDVYNEILGNDANRWVEFDQCSYDWWINVRSGHYKEALDIDAENYFSDDDRKELEKLRAALKQKCDAIDDLGEDEYEDDTYYEKLDAYEEQAEELANKMLKIVEREIKSIEEVTDDQIVDEFIDCEYGDDFYILNGDHTKVYRDYTKCYKVGK